MQKRWWPLAERERSGGDEEDRRAGGGGGVCAFLRAENDAAPNSALDAAIDVAWRALGPRGAVVVTSSVTRRTWRGILPSAPGEEAEWENGQKQGAKVKKEAR